MDKPLPRKDAREFIGRRHQEWKDHEYLWRHTLDSLEGGNAYRIATYGTDPASGEPVRNLIRHKKELPEPFRPGEYGVPQSYGYFGQRDPGEDPHGQAMESSYQNRLSRTPVPSLFADGVRRLLSRLFSKEITRTIPEAGFDDLKTWIKDVDGRGTDLDEWLAEEVGELLLALGQIDIQVTRPPKPAGAEIITHADEAQAGLDGVIASVILPQNMLWWRTDFRGRYLECLVCEYHEDEKGRALKYFRHWDVEASILYDEAGAVALEGQGGGLIPNALGQIPIRRIFDRRKIRCRNVGQSRVGAALELQREFYNVDSELTLVNSLQAHPSLQGPPSENASEVTVGPDFILQKQVTARGDVIGYEYVEPPKSPAQFLQDCKQDLADRIDRVMCQTKPAGAVAGSTVAQSGVSKAMDQRDGNDLLSKIGRSFGRFEGVVFELVLLVARDGDLKPEALDAIKISYPGGFNLLAADDLASLGTEWSAWLETVGQVPEVEKAYGRQFLSLMLPGQDDESYEEQCEALNAYIDARAKALGEAAEGDTDQAQEGTEPSGESVEPPEVASPNEPEPKGAPGIAAGPAAPPSFPPVMVSKT